MVEYLGIRLSFLNNIASIDPKSSNLGGKGGRGGLVIYMTDLFQPSILKSFGYYIVCLNWV